MLQIEFERKQSFDLFERRAMNEFTKLKAFRKRVEDIHDIGQGVGREFLSNTANDTDVGVDGIAADNIAVAAEDEFGQRPVGDINEV